MARAHAVAAMDLHGLIAQPPHGEGEVGEPFMARQDLTGEAQAAHVEPAVGLRRIDRCRREPAAAAGLGNQVAAGPVNVAMVDPGEMRRSPGLQPHRPVSAAGVEERPVEEAAVGHQSPSKIGLRFATKAS